MKVGIIGCGSIARSHLKGYQAYGAEIVAVADSFYDSASKLAAEVDAKPLIDYRELLKMEDIQAVSICTPPSFHEDIAIMALEQGKHVICEKPMSRDVASAKRMRAAKKKTECILMPAFRYRFIPAIQKMHALIEEGVIGTPVLMNTLIGGPLFHMEDRWSTQKSVSGGGCLLDLAIFSVDLFRYLFGEVLDQNALSHQHFETTDVEDVGVITVKSKSGCLGVMQAGYVLGEQRDCIEIMGTKGSLYFSFRASDAINLSTPDGQKKIEVTASDGFVEEIKHFLDVVDGKEELACSSKDGVRCLEIVCNTYPKAAVSLLRTTRSMTIAKNHLMNRR